MSDQESKCKFCTGKNCSITRNLNDKRSYFYHYDCDNCGQYQLEAITARLWSKLNRNKRFGNFHLHCISETIRANNENLLPLWLNDRQNEPELTDDDSVVVKYFEDYENTPISHVDKPDELLRIIAKKTQDIGPFEYVMLKRRDLYILKIKDEKEAVKWLNDLWEKKLISYYKPKRTLDDSVHPSHDQLFFSSFSLTPKGWHKINELFSDLNSKQAFIAMDFKNEERGKIQQAIQEACKKTGWDAFTIDQKEYQNNITDQIIAEIKKSKFVVAEFTSNNSGVYYEAGFASGRNIPVIYVVKEGDDLKNLHFDTKHINHIVWKDYSDLTTRLINRIEAVIN